jgi:hypothetical protein
MERRASIDEEPHRAAVTRFDVAYAKAADELRSPIRLTAADFLL